jgi:hypothetical protein
MSMSRGLVALSDVVYFLSAITIFLAGTKTLLERRQW